MTHMWVLSALGHHGKADFEATTVQAQVGFRPRAVGAVLGGSPALTFRLVARSGAMRGLVAPGGGQWRPPYTAPPGGTAACCQHPRSTPMGGPKQVARMSQRLRRGSQT